MNRDGWVEMGGWFMDGELGRWLVAAWLVGCSRGGLAAWLGARWVVLLAALAPVGAGWRAGLWRALVGGWPACLAPFVFVSLLSYFYASPFLCFALPSALSLSPCLPLPFLSGVAFISSFQFFLLLLLRHHDFVCQC